MADKTVIIRLDVQEAGAISSINGLNNSLKGLDRTSEEYAEVLRKIQVEEARLSKIQSSRVTAQGNVSKAQTSATKSLNSQSDATGSATAATMELSRVVSDAPYGIRGMANNITQLVSQLGSAATKAGGLSAALKLMWKSMMGPLGVVFAITAVVSALDYFYGGMKKAEEAGKSFSEGLSGLEKNLSSLFLTQTEVNGKIEEYIVLQGLKADLDKSQKKIDEDLIKSTDKLMAAKDKLKSADTLILANQKLLEDSSDKESQKAKGYAKGVEKNTKIRLKALQEIKDAENEYKDVVNTSLEKLKEYRLAEDKIKESKAGTVTALKLQKSELEKEQSILSKTSEKWEEYAKKIKDKQAEIDLITGGSDKKTGKTGKKVKRDKVDVLGLDSIDIEENKKKMRRVLDAVAEAVNIDLKEDPLKIVPELDMELSADAKARVAESISRASKEIILNSRLDDAQKFLEKSKEILGSMTSFISGEYDREMTIEQNKTNALNQELNNRLLNENLSKDERAKIQNQIAQNDEKLRVKQDSINRKKFNAEKAANIAMTLMNTATAAVGVMKDAKGGFLARLAQAIPTIAFGLAQVATIARTKYQSMTPSTPSRTSSGGSGGSGGGSGRAEPSFNIVGRSNENILLNAIQAQFDKPLKAYVVARDVTNQQQLDGIISNTSSI